MAGPYIWLQKCSRPIRQSSQKDPILNKRKINFVYNCFDNFIITLIPKPHIWFTFQLSSTLAIK